MESAAWPAESVTLDRLDQESGRDADDRPRRTLHAASSRAISAYVRLVVSEKTVRVHVSNMLRKTGSAGRIELTRMAQSTVTAGPG